MNASGDTPSIAVIGGGWAGCAAAVTLAQSAVRVTLFEQARVLGGRARRVGIEGIGLDNGQHLCVGAYRQTLSLIDRVHGSHRSRALFHRLPLTLRPFGVRRADAASFSAWRAPAPLHLLGGFLVARGLSWRDRWSLISGFRALQRTQFQCPAQQSVAECFATAPDNAMNAWWSPLCIAALNTHPQHASAQLFANVLRATFTGRALNSHLLLPATDLSSLFPDAAMRYIEARGATTRIGCNVRGVARHDHDVMVTTSTGHERYRAAIVAVGPHQLAATVGSTVIATSPWRSVLRDVAAFAYEPIATVYLAYDAVVPMPWSFARLDDAPGQWVFDRSVALRGTSAPNAARTLLAVVISAGGEHDQLDHRALIATVDAQLRRLAGAMPAVVWSRVIAERRATYACTPALQRPSAGRVAPGLYVAGDYTEPNLPPTLEAATRSGVIAAKALLADLNLKTA